MDDNNDMDNTRPIRPHKVAAAAAATLSRQKACERCIKSKRRCDMQVPQCGRCGIKGFACVYSKDSSNPMLASHRSVSVTTTSAAMDPDMGWLDSVVLNPQHLALQQTPMIAEEEWLNAASLVMSGVSSSSDTTPELLPTPEDSSATSANTSPGYGSSKELTVVDGKELFVRKMDDAQGDSVSSEEADFFLKLMQQLPKTFIDTLQTLFIHPRLYSFADKPVAITNLFGTCAAYLAKSRHNEDAIFRMVNTEVERIFATHSDNVNDVHLNLPLAQAFLLYQIIRLFDGNIRQRAVAERQQAKLLAWSDQLHQAIRRNDLAATHPNATPSSVRVLSDWDSWVFWECVSRTVFLIAMMDGLYKLLRDNVCGCDAKIMSLRISLNRKLWAASSPAEWRQVLGQTGKLEFAMHNGVATEIASLAPPANINEMGIILESSMHGLEHARDVFGSRVNAMIET